MVIFMAQEQIIKILRRHRGQRLTASQIAILIGNSQKGNIARQCRELREFGMIKWSYKEQGNTYYYYL